MKINLRRSAGFILLGILGFAILLPRELQKMRRRNEFRTMNRARAELEVALKSIEAYRKTNRSLPAPLLQPVISSNAAREIYSVLFPPNLSGNQPPARWKEAGALVDFWSQPLGFLASRKGTNPPQYLLIWSPGPNQTNENGRGDDLLKAFKL